MLWTRIVGARWRQFDNLGPCTGTGYVFQPSQPRNLCRIILVALPARETCFLPLPGELPVLNKNCVTPHLLPRQATQPWASCSGRIGAYRLGSGGASVPPVSAGAEAG